MIPLLDTWNPPRFFPPPLPFGYVPPDAAYHPTDFFSLEYLLAPSPVDVTQSGHELHFLTYLYSFQETRQCKGKYGERDGPLADRSIRKRKRRRSYLQRFPAAPRVQRQSSIPGLVSYTWKRTFVRRLWPTKSSFHGSSRAIFSNNDFTILRRGEGKKKKKIQASASTQSIAGDRGKKM